MDLSRFFQFDESIRVWVEKAHQPFDYSDGEEQEKYILDALRGSADVSTSSVELFGRMVDWPSTYHLTPRRGNLLRPFKSWFAGKRILEIGCGCGAMTRFLGEAGATVVSVEGSLMRATIARERCRDLDNVEIICATSEKIDLLGEFDGVMLIGVLEYARKFLGEDGTRRLLADCAARLGEGGNLFVAIENQLGLKYFAGAAEDHTGVPMLGIEERYSPVGVATFGQEELGRHIAAVGLDSQQWWYPFPDYKLPLSLFNEDAASGRLGADFGPMIASASSADPQRPFYQVFSPERAWMPVFRNGLASALANSFLVIASRKQVAVSDPAVVACHYSVERLPEFAKALQIRQADEGRLVVRHSRVFPDRPFPPSNVQALPVDDAPFFAGEHWQHRLSQLLSVPGWSVETFTEWYERWLQALKIELGLGAKDPLPALDTPIDGRLVDGLPRNLIVSGEQARFFDLEWKLGESIELGYLLFRGAYCSLWELRSVAAPAEGTSLHFRALFEAALARTSVTVGDDALERFARTERDFQQSTAGRSSVDRDKVFHAELIVAPTTATEMTHLNEQILLKDDALKVQRTEIHRLNRLREEKAPIFEEMSSQIRQLNERIIDEVGEKDRIIVQLSEEIRRLNGVLQAKDSQIAMQTSEGINGELAQLRARIEQKDAEVARHSELMASSEEALATASRDLEASRNLLEMQGNRIRELEQAARSDALLEQVSAESEHLRAQLDRSYEARDALARTKWFRLRDALTRRPLSARQFARAAYLIGAMSTPRLAKRPLSRFVSQARALISPPPDPVVPQLPAVPVARRGSSANSYIVRQNKPDLAQRPRVLHVIANFMTGGSSKLVVDLIEGIGHRYQQTILTSFIPTPEAYTGVDIHEIRQPGEAAEFLAFFKAQAPDFIHVHYWGDCDEPWYAKAFAAAEALNIPVVQNINTPVAPFLSPSIVRNVYVSQYVEHEFGVQDAPSCVIYPGSDFSLFSLRENEKPSGTRVGMVYRLERDKLNESAIVPFIRVAQMNSKARILIVGGGSLLEPFKASVAQAGVSEQFDFTGYVGYDELPNLYRQMAVFVAPVWKESFGQVSPFAMNMQVPVVGYDVGAIGEIVDDENYLAPAGDAEELAKIVNQLLQDIPERSRLALAHKNRAQQHFSLQAMVSAYCALYDNVHATVVSRNSSSAFS
ncbi:glycosyltransferase [Caballeronia sp. LZ001]|uniref:glycosyltransferase n=1 Tax=Caballeronia sp. LZ001 TaxID=3038553 RepID=UPI0028594333|nr:glycosyltransferase [Caballeronia sp. LZ001]MDR5804193.1 glycosyltransferase [Caballeronia sp. LZ001]